MVYIFTIGRLTGGIPDREDTEVIYALEIWDSVADPFTSSISLNLSKDRLLLDAIKFLSFLSGY